MIPSHAERKDTYDEDGKRILGVLSEDYLIYEQLKTRPATFRIDSFGNRIDVPEKRGIDTHTCEPMDFVNWFADTRIKKSETARMNVMRKMAVRFPTEFARYKTKIDQRYRLEMEMIESKATNDPRFFGEVSYGEMVRLDGSLSNPKNKVIKLKNENFKVVRIN